MIQLKATIFPGSVTTKVFLFSNLSAILPLLSLMQQRKQSHLCTLNFPLEGQRAPSLTTPLNRSSHSILLHSSALSFFHSACFGWTMYCSLLVSHFFSTEADMCVLSNYVPEWRLMSKI